MSKIQQKYEQHCRTNSDIFQHLPALLQYGMRCKTIAEFGVRNAVSCYAFALAKPSKLICVDIAKTPGAEEFIKDCKEENINVQFDVADSREYSLEPVDLLFIDTLHTYGQLEKELELHHDKVSKYIIFHDTISYGFTDETHVYQEVKQNDPTDISKKGLIPAIINFLQKNPQWYHFCTYNYNNGLTVIARR